MEVAGALFPTFNPSSLVQFSRDREIDSAVIQSIRMNNVTGADLLRNSSICGLPGFCIGNVKELCRNETFISCESCGESRAAGFLSLVLLLGITILIANGFTLLVGYHHIKQGTLKKMDICRSSLAISDILTGVQILIVAVYNFSWTIHTTIEEIDAFQLASRGSTKAFFGGLLYMLGYTSSVYHLSYMGLLRLFAVAFPFRYRFASNTPIIWNLVIVWILSVLSATVPAWFPSVMTFSYFPAIFLYFPTLQQVTLDPNISAVFGFLTFFYVVPYLLTVITSITTAIMIQRGRQANSRNLHSSSDSQTHIQRELSVFKTMILMQLGFTILMIPIIVVVLLSYSGSLTCAAVARPLLACVYFSMSNSLVNAAIYNIRNKQFRGIVKDYLTSACNRCTSKFVTKRNEDH